MEPPKINFERKLLTIMSCDVVGYSRLMAKEEEKTLNIFIGHKKIFETEVATHKGRIFNTAGDAILAEFPSAVEAVYCAIRIQEQLWELNKGMDPAKAVAFRIGLNLGDVLVQGSDLLGDGVNVAARIQTAAMPGGVCISGSVFDQIQGKITLSTIFMGEKLYKNIPKAVRTYAVNFPGRTPPAGQKRAPRLRASIHDSKPTAKFNLLFLAIAFLALLSYVFTNSETGYRLSGANCSLASKVIPENLIDHSLEIAPELIEVLREPIDCTPQMNCYQTWKPWKSLEISPESHHAPFTEQELFLSRFGEFAVFFEKDHSLAHIRAVKYKSDTDTTWGSQECTLIANSAKIFPAMKKLSSIFK